LAALLSFASEKITESPATVLPYVQPVQADEIADFLTAKPSARFAARMVPVAKVPSLLPGINASVGKRGRLASWRGGQATVSLEPGFASIVHTDAYRVFLTPLGESEGLYVTSRKGAGFTVQEQHGGKSNIAFDYRVVAKRADIAGARLEDVNEPPSFYQPPEPALDHAPKPPEQPAMPTSPTSRPGG
jgi:hypothetical protein